MYMKQFPTKEKTWGINNNSRVAGIKTSCEPPKLTEETPPRFVYVNIQVFFQYLNKICINLKAWFFMRRPWHSCRLEKIAIGQNGVKSVVESDGRLHLGESPKLNKFCGEIAAISSKEILLYRNFVPYLLKLYTILKALHKFGTFCKKPIRLQQVKMVRNRLPNLLHICRFCFFRASTFLFWRVSIQRMFPQFDRCVNEKRGNVCIQANMCIGNVATTHTTYQNLSVMWL